MEDTHVFISENCELFVYAWDNFVIKLGGGKMSASIFCLLEISLFLPVCLSLTVTNVLMREKNQIGQA